MLTPEEEAEARELIEDIEERIEGWPSLAKPNKPQATFLASPAKFRAFSGGFGAGKTRIGAHEALDAARNYPGSLGLVVAPSYPELRDYTQRMFFQLLGTDADTAESHKLVAKFNRSENHLRFTNGSEVFFRSADKPSTLVGSTVDWFWLDEPASCGAITWKQLLGRLRGETGPRRGWCTGTPQGFNWVYREFAERERDDYFLVTASTFDNADNLAPDYVESMSDSYTGVFARAKLFGEFVAFEGQVYRFDRSKHLTDSDWTPEPKLPYDRCADFGTNNPTAWLWVQEIAGTVYVFDELEVRRQPVSVIAAEVKAKRNGELMHGSDFGDIAGTQRDSNLSSYVANYAQEGIRITTRSGGRVRAGIEVVTRYLDSGRLKVHPRCTRLIAAFETYHWPEDKDGAPIGDEPVKDGVSDHMMDALRYWFVNRHAAEFARPSCGMAGSGSGGMVTQLPGGLHGHA